MKRPLVEIYTLAHPRVLAIDSFKKMRNGMSNNGDSSSGSSETWVFLSIGKNCVPLIWKIRIVQLTVTELMKIRNVGKHQKDYCFHLNQWQ